MKYIVGIYQGDDRIDEKRIDSLNFTFEGNIEELTVMQKEIIINKVKKNFNQKVDPLGEIGGTIGFDFKLERVEKEATEEDE